jgi:ubiquinone/menaquinone biosynthesis C-methylase UbiE
VTGPTSWPDRRLAALARGRVLDVGCGEGRFLPRGAVGIDLDPARLRIAKGRSDRLALADAHALPFADATFDVVFANRVLNDAGRIDDVLREIRRVLRVGGSLAVYTRARPAEGDRLDAKSGEARLRSQFTNVVVERDPDDERGAIFVASG